MRTSIIATIFLFSISFLYGQVVPSDMENRSSILNMPNSVGVDISDEKIIAEFNNLSSQITNPHKFIYGLYYAGGNTNNVSMLFDKGDFVSGSEMRGFIGGSFKILPGETKLAWEQYEAKQKEIIAIQNGAYISWKNKFEIHLNSTISKISDDKKAKVTAAIYRYFFKTTEQDLIENTKKIKEAKKPDTTLSMLEYSILVNDTESNWKWDTGKGEFEKVNYRDSLKAELGVHGLETPDNTLIDLIELGI